MCHHCFDVVLQELQKQNKTWISTSMTLTSVSMDALPPPDVECPLFVTWDKRASSSYMAMRRKGSQQHAPPPERFELRGCMGTLSPKPLASSLGEYARISAFRDRRFDPLSWSEVPHVRVAVSLLVQYEDCEHCHDWTVGVHGILIQWQWEGCEYSATYLPEVAIDQGWDQPTTVNSLIRKAGYRGTITDTMKDDIQCTRYQSSKHRVSFDEYIESTGLDVSQVFGNASQKLQLADGSDGGSNCVVS
jgi:AMME syndrome candidate gene 1 protein